MEGKIHKLNDSDREVLLNFANSSTWAKLKHNIIEQLPTVTGEEEHVHQVLSISGRAQGQLEIIKYLQVQINPTQDNIEDVPVALTHGMLDPGVN